jgi:hypothetical protein
MATLSRALRRAVPHLGYLFAALVLVLGGGTLAALFSLI